MSSYKHMHNACNSNVNAIFHVDQNTVLQENSFDCEDSKDNNQETIVISHSS